MTEALLKDIIAKRQLHKIRHDKKRSIFHEQLIINIKKRRLRELIELRRLKFTKILNK